MPGRAAPSPPTLALAPPLAPALPLPLPSPPPSARPLCQPGQGRLGPTFPAGCCVHPTEYVRMCTLAWLKKVRSFGTRNVSGCVSTSSASLSGESSPVCGSSELGARLRQAAGSRLQASGFRLQAAGCRLQAAGCTGAAPAIQLGFVGGGTAAPGVCARVCAGWCAESPRAGGGPEPSALACGRARAASVRAIQTALSTHGTLRSCGAQRRRPRRDARRGCRASGRARAAVRATAGAPPPP